MEEQRFGLGCDLTEVPLASEVPKLDLKKVLGVDTANPLLRAARIEEGLLEARRVPRELRERTPLASDEQSL